MPKAAGILFTDGEYILFLKGKDWELPGGKAKIGENAKQNAEREAREECGKVFGREIDKFTFSNFTIFVYKVNYRFDCRLSKEHKDWKWIKIKDIKQYKLREELIKQLPVVLKSMKNLNFKEWLELQEGLFSSAEQRDFENAIDALRRKHHVNINASNLLMALRASGKTPEEIDAVSAYAKSVGQNYGDLNKADLVPDQGEMGSGPGYRKVSSLASPADRPGEDIEMPYKPDPGQMMSTADLVKQQARQRMNVPTQPLEPRKEPSIPLPKR